MKFDIEVKKLNVGCGYRKLKDHWNVDIDEKCNPDQVLDLEKTPWPFEDDFFETITVENSLQCLGEQSETFINIIKEMYRVSKDKTQWNIICPYYRSNSFTEFLENVRPISKSTFEGFDITINEMLLQNEINTNLLAMKHSVDLEIIDIDYTLSDYYKNLQNSGMIGPSEINIKLNTTFNVCDSITLFIRVHKPSRKSK